MLSSLSSGFALLLSLWLTELVSAVSLPGFPMPIELQLNPDFRVLLYAVAQILIENQWIKREYIDAQNEQGVEISGGQGGGPRSRQPPRSPWCRRSSAAIRRP